MYWCCASSHVADDTGYGRRSQALAQCDFAPSAVARLPPFSVIRFMGTRPSLSVRANGQTCPGNPCLSPAKRRWIPEYTRSYGRRSVLVAATWWSSSTARVGRFTGKWPCLGAGTPRKIYTGRLERSRFAADACACPGPGGIGGSRPAVLKNSPSRVTMKRS